MITCKNIYNAIFAKINFSNNFVALMDSEKITNLVEKVDTHSFMNRHNCKKSDAHLCSINFWTKGVGCTFDGKRPF